MGKGRATAYDPPVDSSSPAAAEYSAEVGGALVPRTAQISADIYQLIVREIPQVSGDTRVLKLLEASVGENVATVLHVIQHGIDLENVHAPAAAQEYARRLAQRGVPVAALLRAYRIGSTRFEEWCLEELAQLSPWQRPSPARLSQQADLALGPAPSSLAHQPQAVPVDDRSMGTAGPMSLIQP
jgi:hypothetical protein